MCIHPRPVIRRQNGVDVIGSYEGLKCGDKLSVAGIVCGEAFSVVSTK